MTEDYPLPDMETLFHELKGSKFYVKIDSSSAYYQIMLDDAAQEIRVINTRLSLFKLLRLPQGMKNSSGMFQRTIENTLKGLAGNICFQDDVLVHGRTKSQSEKRRRAVLDHLKDKGFTINEIKSGNVMEKITFRLMFELASKPVVQPYSLKKEVTITTDASEKAIGGVLYQEGHSVIYVSKTLSPAEQRYSNIEREALAIVLW